MASQPILIDTNVLIYLYDHVAERRQARAQAVLDQLALTQTGRLSVQNLAEFSSVATRKLSPLPTPAEAYDQNSLLTRIWPVFDLTPLIALETARGVCDYQLSNFDAQIWATARLNRVALILSEKVHVG